MGNIVGDGDDDDDGGPNLVHHCVPLPLFSEELEQFVLSQTQSWNGAEYGTLLPSLISKIRPRWW